MIDQTRYTDKRIVKWLEAADEGGTVVEFGAGICNYTRHTRARKRIAVDLSQENLDRCPSPSVRLVAGNMRHWETLRLGKFDTAVFIDSLEHIHMREGLKLIYDLKAAEHVKQILAFVPMGEHKQEDHLSTWWPNDLRMLGFGVEEVPDFHADRDAARGAMFAVWKR